MDDPVEIYARKLHEAGRAAVEKGLVVKRSITFTCSRCGNAFHQGEAEMFGDVIACPKCTATLHEAKVVTQNEKFLEWNEISEPAREGRRVQARFILDN